jgi:hypothetical protein
MAAATAQPVNLENVVWKDILREEEIDEESTFYC